MPRLKTFLSPDDQWARTVEYLYFLHLNKWTAWDNWRELYEFKITWNHAPKLSEEELLLLWRKERKNGPLIDKRACLGVVIKPHKLLCVDDILVMSADNGMNERFPTFGVSSKGARLSYYYLQFNLSRKQYRSPFVDLVELPGDLIGHRWDDPAVRRFVADLRATRMRPGRRV